MTHPNHNKGHIEHTHNMPYNRQSERIEVRYMISPLEEIAQVATANVVNIRPPYLIFQHKNVVKYMRYG